MIKNLLSRLIPRSHRSRHIHARPLPAPLLLPVPVTRPAPALARHVPRRRPPAGYVGATYRAGPRLPGGGPRSPLFRVT
jgi:hypothetical protein